ncbi:MAG: cupin [Burkholderiales bacterium]|jgi:quercetin dioxygenase-like cupin family protein|nr:cupin [Burkholderiales bacterium]
MIETENFTAALLRDGYLDVETRTIGPNIEVPLHSHAFDVRALVLSGQAGIDCGQGVVVYRSGDVVEVAAGCPHTESYGPQGYTFLVGRRHPA